MAVAPVLAVVVLGGVTRVALTSYWVTAWPPSVAAGSGVHESVTDRSVEDDVRILIVGAPVGFP